MPNPIVTVVIHGAGTSKSDDIVEAILTDNIAQRERGITELGKRGTTAQIVNMQIKYRTGVALQQMIEVVDELQGQAWRGKIVGVEHRVKNASLTSFIEVEKPNAI